MCVAAGIHVCGGLRLLQWLSTSCTHSAGRITEPAVPFFGRFGWQPPPGIPPRLRQLGLQAGHCIYLAFHEDFGPQVPGTYLRLEGLYLLSHLSSPQRTSWCCLQVAIFETAVASDLLAFKNLLVFLDSENDCVYHFIIIPNCFPDYHVAQFIYFCPENWLNISKVYSSPQKMKIDPVVV